MSEQRPQTPGELSEFVEAKTTAGNAIGSASYQEDVQTPASTASTTIPLPERIDTNDTQESMAEPELLALIIELRLGAGRRPSKDKDKGNASSSSKSMSSAVDTLDLCHRKIEKLPFEMVNIIQDDVVRLALGYNFITSLPANFTDLSRLRYLNVRANLMNIFPSVLCTLPSLEILDISRNKIRKLPQEPGRLLELRVLSISNNRLKKLPVWMHRMRHLRILKLEGNPVSWPPPHVSVMPPLDKMTTVDPSALQVPQEEETDKVASQVAKKKAEDRHMALWVSQLKGWIEENKEKGRSDQKEVSSQIKPETENSFDSVSIGPVESLSIASVNGSAAPRSETMAGSKPSVSTYIDPQTPGETKRSIGAAFLSIESEGQSDDEKDQADEVIALPVKIPSEVREMPLSKESMQREIKDEPAPAPVEPIKEESKVASASDPLSRQPVPEPPHQPEEGTMPLRIASSLALQQATQLMENEEAPTLKATPSISSNHGKNDSISTMPASSSMSNTNVGSSTLRRGLLRNKKSLPDLRQNHGTTVSERGEVGGDAGFLISGDLSSSQQRQRRPSAHNLRRPPLPQTNSESAATTMSIRAAGFGDVWPSNVTENSDNGASSSGENKSSTSAGAVEVERNSYFKRLSTLPASTISKNISVPVLECIDATRGVLYALSQMHTALKQYITFASDERMTSQLSRALDIASRSMAGLINSLDRFDSLSRIKGGTLNPIVVRGVLVSCSESVGTFRKIVSLLQLQLKSLQRAADIRYTKTLLLLLYGSLAEIHNSWSVMEPLFKDVMPYLQGQDVINSNTANISLATGPTLSAGPPYTLPSIAEASSPVSPNSARFNITQTRPLRRRHAGSFSAHDVAQGAFMVPSAPLPIHGYEEIRKAQRPAALGPFSVPPQSLMYQIQQGDVDGTDLTESNVPTPIGTFADPQTPKDRSRRAAVEEESNAAVMSRRTLSNTSGGNVSAKSTSNQASGNPLASTPYSTEVVEVMVDDHLVLLLVKITSIAYSVWASINDHLNSIGIPAAVNRGATRMNYPTNQYVTPDSTPQIDSEGFIAATASPHTPARMIRPVLEGSSSSMTVMPYQSEETMSPASNPSQIAAIAPSSQLHEQHLSNTTSLAKLRSLRDSTHRLIEQTNRLEACCDKVQERSGIHSPTMVNINTFKSAGGSSSAETFKDVFIESSSFIKSILQISHFIKSLSLDHQFPKVIKVNLAQLTTCARDLTLHLHFLGGPTVQGGSVTSPAQHRQAKE